MHVKWCTEMFEEVELNISEKSKRVCKRKLGFISFAMIDVAVNAGREINRALVFPW